MKSRRCIFHIGPHKTGSSSIQKTLFTSLQDNRFAYAKLGCANQGPKIHSIFASPGRTLPQHEAKAMTSQAVLEAVSRAKRQLNRALARSSAETVIFSGERVSVMQETELVALRDYLLIHFDVIDIVGYVRPPAAYLTSIFQEMIKKQFFSFSPLTLNCRYRSILEKFDRVFGRGHVFLFKFDPIGFPNGDIVQHFFLAMGIAPPELYHRVNESLSKPAVQIIYAYQKFGNRLAPGPDVPALQIGTALALSSLPGVKFRLAEEVLRPVLERNRDDIIWAEERIGASLAEEPAVEAGAVRNEAEMLDISPETIVALEELVASKTDLPSRGSDPAVHAARLVERLIEAIRTTHRSGNRHRSHRRRNK
jgi:hypothetical protein